VARVFVFDWAQLPHAGSRYCHDARIGSCVIEQAAEENNVISKIHHVLDPLDVEILERALDQAWAAFKGCETSIESGCDQALEAALQRELIEIGRVATMPKLPNRSQ